MPKAITVTGSPGSSDYRSDINRLQATMAQAVGLRPITPRTPGFEPGPVRTGFEVDKLVLGQVLPVLPIFPVSIITTMLHTHLHLSIRVHKSWGRQVAVALDKSTQNQ